MAFLKHLYNGNIISVYELGDVTVIGRHVDCHIRVEDATVSGQHARIEKKPKRASGESEWCVVDLGSTNGVFVNGKSVSEYTLKNATEFTLGTHAFEFHFDLPEQLDQTLKIKKSWIPGIYYTE
jgi:pSer/pThr/pTyr-binding forkhead associated (FHA) protein